MATYEKEYLNTISEETNLRMSFSLTERPVYGSSRIVNFTIKSFTNKGTKAE